MKQAQQAQEGKGVHTTPQINGQTSITIAQSISTLSTGKSEPAIFLSFALRVNRLRRGPCAVFPVVGAQVRGWAELAHERHAGG